MSPSRRRALDGSGRRRLTVYRYRVFQGRLKMAKVVKVLKVLNF